MRWNELTQQWETPQGTLSGEAVELNGHQLGFAKQLGITPLEYAQQMALNRVFSAYRQEQLARHMGYRGPCEICSAVDQVLYQAPVRSSEGHNVTLNTCWDCWEATKD